VENWEREGRAIWLKWLPWKFIVRKMASAHGFLDPVSVLSRMRNFSQPSEVHEPVELLRSGVILHARGLMNSRAIQQNLDWVWPWWVERQFNPEDPAFVPRAFSLTHINLTHRNWTAFGIPDMDVFPLVDPSGGVIPFTDMWTIEGWIITDTGTLLAPSRLEGLQQKLFMKNNLVIETISELYGSSLVSRAEMQISDGRPFCRIQFTGRSSKQAWIVLSLRPYNPEGVSFINDITLDRGEEDKWLIEGDPLVTFDNKVEFHTVSDYHAGDVSIDLNRREEKDHVTCNVGMSTAAAMFRLDPEEERSVSVRVDLDKNGKDGISPSLWSTAAEAWDIATRDLSYLSVPDKRIQFLYDCALRTLILHSPEDVYPGPYTYKRFWFRDAAFIINSMLCVNMTERSFRSLDRFPSRQNPFGFFHSQEGEWDSNGEALWIMNRYCELTESYPSSVWRSAAERGANWILRKRISRKKGAHCCGLLPAGFSAEHLGPNDYYYWDNFWGVAGLRSAARILEKSESYELAGKYLNEADEYIRVIEEYLQKSEKRLGRQAIPAAPYRRLDPGAVGSIVAGYPLQLWPAHDKRVLDTVEWLKDNCFIHGGFFQDMIHSGINAYLTLHIAQIFLRANDKRAFELIQNVADMASPTGQWPEAIHPRTGGGCMGDGQHVWAAAEWVMAIRNSFVLEESQDGSLVLGSGIPGKWLAKGVPMSFGPTPTPWGPLKIKIIPGQNKVRVTWEARWFKKEPVIKIRLEGFEDITAEKGSTHIEIEREHG